MSTRQRDSQAPKAHEPCRGPLPCLARAADVLIRLRWIIGSLILGVALGYSIRVATSDSSKSAGDSTEPSQRTDTGSRGLREDLTSGATVADKPAHPAGNVFESPAALILRLVKEKNGNLLLDVIDSLVRGPESGYPDAVHGIEALLNGAFFFDRARLESLLQSESTPFGLWVLERDGRAQAPLRQMIAMRLVSSIPQRVAESRGIELLLAESDSTVAMYLAMALPTTESSLEAIENALKRHTADRQAVAIMISRLSGGDGFEAARRLTGLTSHSDPYVRELAGLQLLKLRPPCTGLLVLAAQTAPAAVSASRIETGDIITCIDGAAPPLALAEWETLLSGLSGRTFEVRVFRRGREMSLDCEASALRALSVWPVEGKR